jgi:hypothetical protein
MRRGPGFHGSLVNVDLSGDPKIDHLTIDKSPRLHARVISEVLSVVGSHRGTEPAGPDSTRASASPPSSVEGGTKAGPPREEAAKPGEATSVVSAPTAAATKTGDGTPVIALPERGAPSATSNAAAAPPHQSPATAQP